MTELPRDEALRVPVSVISTSAMPVQIRQGTVRRYDGATYEVEVSEGALEPDTEVVLDFSREDLPHVRAKVLDQVGTRLRLGVVTSRKRDPRDFPRMAAGIRLRYRTVPQDAGEEALAAWLAGGPLATEDATWRTPDPLMDFSASGFGFEDTKVCAQHDDLLLELQAPDGDRAWRGRGQVVRVVPREGRWHIAVTLTDVPPEAVQALLEFTVELQERALGDAREERS